MQKFLLLRRLIKPSKRSIVFLAAFVIFSLSAIRASAHAVQAGYIVLPNGFLRVYIEHWHGDMTAQSLVGNGMSVTTTYGSTTVTQNVNPTGAFNNTAWNNLPGAGSGIIILAQGPSANQYNDWAYYDFPPAACNVPVQITLNGGLTVVLEEETTSLWPRTIAGTFVDNSGPTITPSNTTASVGCGVAGTNVNFSATSIDNCTPNNPISYSIAPGSFFPVGTTNVTATSSDANGNTTTTTFPVTVNVIDNVAPGISNPGPQLIISCPSILPDYRSLAVVSDDCTAPGNITVTQSPAPGTMVQPGTTISVTLTARDGANNTSSCTFNVTQVLPTATITAFGPLSFCPGGSVQLTANAATSYQWSTGETTQSITVTTGGSYNVRVTNATGCQSNPSQNVNVTVNALPTSVISAAGPTTFCDGGSVSLNASGSALQSILNNFNSNISGITAPISNQFHFAMDGNMYGYYYGYNNNMIADGGYDMYDVGNYLNTNFAGQISYTDGSIVNSSAFGTGGSYFTHYNNGVFMMAADVNGVNNFYTSGNLGADGQGSTHGYRFNVTIGGNTFSCYYRQVRDGYGYDPSINQLIIIPGNSSATQSFSSSTDDGFHSVNGIGSSRIYYYLWAGASAYSFNNTEVNNIANAFLSQIGASAGGSSSTGPVSYLWSNGATTPSITVNQSGSFTVTTTTQEGCSTTSAVTTVTVNPLPEATITANGSTALCQGESVMLTASAGGSYQWFLDGNYYGGGQAIYASAPGNYTVAVSNAQGCSSTSAPVFVSIKSAPYFYAGVGNVSCPNESDGSINVYAYGGNGTYQYSIDGGATFGNSNVFSNLSSGSYIVIVSSNGCWSYAQNMYVGVNPDVLAPTVPVLADVTGECSATAGIPTATDACAGTVFGTTNDPLTYTTQGSYVITWSFNDGNGNVSTATQNVYVKDVTAPAMPVIADATGECSATATVPTTTDNCAGIISGTTSNALSYSTQGVHVITWTFNDGNGNITTATQNVVVKDLTAPVIVAPASVTAGACNAISLGSAFASDNCGVQSVVNNAPASFPVGTTTITWTVTDIAGNTSTATQTVTVMPAPTVGITVSRSNTTFTGLNPNTIALGYGAQTLTLTSAGTGTGISYQWSTGATTAAINVSPVATTVYTVTVTDQFGCTTTASFTVEVIDVRCGNKNDKVLVCQKTGSASNPMVQICIAPAAVATHLANGSTLGSCNNQTMMVTGQPKKASQIKEEDASVAVYPNPAQRKFNLRLRDFKQGKVLIVITDANGKTVLTKEETVSYKTEDVTIDMSAFANGIYNVRVSGEKGVKNTRVVIAR
jgi:large repetitive protein